MEEKIKNLLIEFDPAVTLATTHKSQGSDMGLFGGWLGWYPYDERPFRVRNADLPVKK